MATVPTDIDAASYESFDVKSMTPRVVEESSSHGSTGPVTLQHLLEKMTTMEVRIMAMLDEKNVATEAKLTLKIEANHDEILSKFLAVDANFDQLQVKQADNQSLFEDSLQPTTDRLKDNNNNNSFSPRVVRLNNNSVQSSSLVFTVVLRKPLRNIITS